MATSYKVSEFILQMKHTINVEKPGLAPSLPNDDNYLLLRTCCAEFCAKPCADTTSFNVLVDPGRGELGPLCSR